MLLLMHTTRGWLRRAGGHGNGVEGWVSGRTAGQRSNGCAMVTGESRRQRCDAGD